MEDDPIVEIFTSINALSNQAKMDFSSIISFKSLPKKTFLLEAGKVANTLFFIQKGLARAFYNQDGEEITFYFAIDGQFIGSVPSLYNGKPSLCAIQLIEDSEVYSFNYQEFESCCARHHDLETAARKLSSRVILREQERIESLRLHTAKERYLLAEEKHPGICNRSPLKYIASYIATSTVSLSRIRAGNQ
ncbi:Crp/Fnr family transcriptional regulator [Candidatus Brachybacter algidus]|uniref:Crp/Fnr family transcriptional regulator n=1 Tax=Candidatus Brachybacter algidus TaxID=2982024 RepID=UPI001E01EDB2|nr:Crp/Fnr family transcriptional regulator [Candidatus Brachybacter algidus]MBK6447924.1 Crp/Fnr family transcriptional regulator [Candidatus Brachybacter algidus]